MASSSSPSLRGFDKPLSPMKRRAYHRHVRYQIFFRHEGEHEGKNIVDGKLSILRERIEQVRKKENMTRMGGWNYGSSLKHRTEAEKRRAIFRESYQILCSITTSLAFVFLSGSLSIFLVSFIVHFYTT